MSKRTYQVITKRHVSKHDITTVCWALGFRPEAKKDGFMWDGERSVRWSNIRPPYQVYPTVTDRSLVEWGNDNSVVFVKNTVAILELIHYKWSDRKARRLFKELRRIGVFRTRMVTLKEFLYRQYLGDHQLYACPSYTQDQQSLGRS